MNGILCNLTQILSVLVTAYTVVLFVYALVSWVPDLRGRWVSYLAAIVEPVLMPIRRIVPPIGGFDIAFLIVILLLQFLVRPLIGSAIVNSCYRLF
ncbi:MAG: YggT family protein [Candidatus Tumulicola sp.]